MKVFVAGATGRTGHIVVQMLLDRGDSAVVVVRDEDKLRDLLKDKDYGKKLEVHEAEILELSDKKLKQYTEGCGAVVNCLGHNATPIGIFGQPRRLVRKATGRLTSVMPESCRYCLMGSEAVTHPDDPERPMGDQFFLYLLRHLMPPHADNEEAATFLMEHNELNWCVVRPTNLVDEEEADGDYVINYSFAGDLLGPDTVSRANVAHFIVDLITSDLTWNQYKQKMPVIKKPMEKSGNN